MWTEPASGTHLNTRYKFLQDKRPFEFVGTLPTVHHVKHIIWPGRTVTKSLVCVGIVTGFTDEPPHRLFHMSDRIVVGMELLARGYVNSSFAEDILAQLPVQLPLTSCWRSGYNQAAFPAMAVEVPEVEAIIGANHKIRPAQPRFVVSNNLAESTPDHFGAFVVADRKLDFVPCLLGTNS